MRSTRLVSALVAALLLVPAVPAQAGKRKVETWSVVGASLLTMTGHGYGHGKGLSQYGAEGAARQGLTWQQIIEFYYPGTTWGEERRRIRVLITGDTTPDLQVLAQPGIRVRSLSSKRTWRLPERRAKKWRLLGVGERTRVQFTRGGGWRTWKQFRGRAQFSSSSGPLTLVTPSGRARYRGVLQSTSARAGQRRETVNVLPLEAYLRGVVPEEIPALWQPAAVAAQSVAARTYAAFERSQPAAAHYDLCDTTQCQVYLGRDAEHPSADAAIAATAGKVVTYDGRPAFTQFSSSSGGWTAAGSMPYLVAQEDPYDGFEGNIQHTWTHTVSDEDIEKTWPAVGDLTSVSVTSRDGNGEWGGRVLELTLAGSGGEVVVTGDDFRSLLGLKSSWFTFTVASKGMPRLAP